MAVDAETAAVPCAAGVACDHRAHTLPELGLADRGSRCHAGEGGGLAGVERRGRVLRRRRRLARDARDVVGIDVFGVIRVGVGAETSLEKDGGGVSVHFAVSFIAGSGACIRVLCRDVANKRVESRVDILDVVLAHDLFVNDRRILLLLGEEDPEHVQLRRKQCLEKKGCKDCDARAWVGRCGGEEEPVDQNMAGAEETEQTKTNGNRVPDGDFPHIAGRVWMRPRLGARIA